MKRPNPSDLVAQVLVYLVHRRRWWCWRNNSGALRVGKRLVRFGAPGSPDVLAVLPGGRLLAVECKQGRGRLTPTQRAWLEGAGAAGALCLVVGSIEALADALAAAGYPEE